MVMATSQLVNYAVVSRPFAWCQTFDTYKAQSLRNAVRSSSGLRWLHLACVDLANNAPSSSIRQSECKDEDDDKPSSYTHSSVHAVRSIQAANDKHAKCQAGTTKYGGSSATPAVGIEEGRDRDGEHEDCRNA